MGDVSAKALVQAKQITFFGNQTGESSPVSPLKSALKKDGLPLQEFNTDEDNKSFDDRPFDDLDDEERAVADFASEIELQSDSVRLRGPRESSRASQ